MKRHEDLFMWDTIKRVTNCSDEVREKIYDYLFGRTWSIGLIEELERKWS